MSFWPATAIRSTDANEERYLRRATRSLTIQSVSLAVGWFSFIVAGLLLLGYAFVHGVEISYIVLGVVCIMIGAPMAYSFWVRWRNARVGVPRSVHRVEGRLSKVEWRDGNATRLHHWELGDRMLIIPDHWRDVLENENRYGLLTAEAVQGPGNELIPLCIGSRLSISRDVQHGLLSLPSKARLVILGFLVILFIVGFGLRFLENDTPDVVRAATKVLGGVSALMAPWAIADMIRIRRIRRRLLSQLPPDERSVKTPLPTPRSLSD